MISSQHVTSRLINGIIKTNKNNSKRNNILTCRCQHKNQEYFHCLSTHLKFQKKSSSNHYVLHHLFIHISSLLSLLYISIHVFTLPLLRTLVVNAKATFTAISLHQEVDAPQIHLQQLYDEAVFIAGSDAH